MTRRAGVVSAHPRQQGFATLLVSLIMLVLVTAIVLAAYSMSTVNLRSVSNLQWRSEAISAGNWALREVVSSKGTANFDTEQTFEIDVDQDSSIDYVVVVNPPECVRSDTVSEDVVSSVTLPEGMGSGARWNTVFEFVARVSGTGVSTGTAVTIRQGMRIILDSKTKQDVCADV